MNHSNIKDAEFFVIIPRYRFLQRNVVFIYKQYNFPAAVLAQKTAQFLKRGLQRLDAGLSAGAQQILIQKFIERFFLGVIEPGAVFKPFKAVSKVPYPFTQQIAGVPEIQSVHSLECEHDHRVLPHVVLTKFPILGHLQSLEEFLLR